MCMHETEVDFRKESIDRDISSVYLATTKVGQASDKLMHFVAFNEIDQLLWPLVKNVFISIGQNSFLGSDSLFSLRYYHLLKNIVNDVQTILKWLKLKSRVLDIFS